MPDEVQSAPLRPARSMIIKNLMPRLPERGKIKIGIKGKTITSQQGNEFQPPVKLDHFRITTLERGPDGNFFRDEEFHERFGEKPTSIPVRLLYDDPALNFVTRYACFLGRTLWCSGDGETATRLSAEAPKTRKELSELKPEPRLVACPCFRRDPAYEGRDKCKMNGNLSVIIEGASGLGGVWNFRTTSYNSIVGIMSSMAFICQITGGVLANIPLLLRLQAKQATDPIKGSQVLIYVVGLEFSGDITQLQQISHQIALRRATTHVGIAEIETEARRILALAPPSDVPLPGDDANEVVEEFYPEQVAASPPPRPRREEFVTAEFDSADAGSSPAWAANEDIPLYDVTNCDGEMTPCTAETVEPNMMAVFSEAPKRGRAAIEAAIENNEPTIYALAATGEHSPICMTLGREVAVLRAYLDRSTEDGLTKPTDEQDAASDQTTNLQKRLTEHLKASVQLADIKLNKAGSDWEAYSVKLLEAIPLVSDPAQFAKCRLSHDMNRLRTAGAAQKERWQAINFSMAERERVLSKQVMRDDPDDHASADSG